MLNRRRLLPALMLLGLAAPAVAQAPATPPKKLNVVASFSILGDLVRQVGGDRVEVKTLVGPNNDAHVFQPSPNDSKTVLAADLVVLNGLNFETWADRLVKASGYKGPILIASTGVKPLEAEEEEEHGHSHGHGHAFDPHAWQSIDNAKLYVANIRDKLAAIDPAGKADYEAKATAYLKALDDLKAEVTAAYAGLPKAKKRVITSHDAFQYYGKTFGIEFIAPQGISTDAEASAKDVAKLIRQIKKEKVTAVFIENMTDPRLIERIAKESGVSLGGALYSDALSDANGPAPTYLDMMRNNAKLLSAAMK